MKHNSKVTAILIGMFLLTQIIGLLVVYAYTPQIVSVNVNGSIQNVTIDPLPAWFQQPAPESSYDSWRFLTSIFFAFAIAIAIIFLFSKYKLTGLLRAWFFIVVTLVTWLTIYAFEILAPFPIYENVALIIPTLIALPIAYFKIFKRNLIVHNLSELLIYPGIAAVFVPLLNIWTIIVLLIAISLYDAWAVWHSGFMQKMANYQIKELKVFGGFFLPYLTKKQRLKLKKSRALAKKSNNKIKDKKMKVSLAILGGGDVVFPIITAGVVLRHIGLIPALIVTLSSVVALFWLFAIAKKGKFYPAMPFISAGLFVGIAIAYSLFYF